MQHFPSKCKLSIDMLFSQTQQSIVRLHIIIFCQRAALLGKFCSIKPNTKSKSRVTPKNLNGHSKYEFIKLWKLDQPHQSNGTALYMRTFPVSQSSTLKLWKHGDCRIGTSSSANFISKSQKDRFYMKQVNSLCRAWSWQHFLPFTKVQTLPVTVRATSSYYSITNNQQGVKSSLPCLRNPTRTHQQVLRT